MRPRTSSSSSSPSSSFFAFAPVLVSLSFLLLSLPCASSHRPHWPRQISGRSLPLETQPSHVAPARIWQPSPAPTPGPGIGGANWRRQQGRQVTLGDQTCGWFQGDDALPWTCQDEYECATNAQKIVACVSDSPSPADFYSECRDYSQAQWKSCTSLPDGIGCCTQTNLPACGLIVWKTDPGRSMWRCYDRPTTITLLETMPAGVTGGKTDEDTVDGGATPPSTARAPSTAVEATAALPSATPADPSASGPSTDPASSPPAGTANAAPSNGPPSSSNPSDDADDKLGAVIGGAVGGVALLLLVAGAAAFFHRRRKQKNNDAADAAAKAAAPHLPPPPGSGGSCYGPVSGHDLPPPPPHGYEMGEAQPRFHLVPPASASTEYPSQTTLTPGLPPGVSAAGAWALTAAGGLYDPHEKLRSPSPGSASHAGTSELGLTDQRHSLAPPYYDDHDEYAGRGSVEAPVSLYSPPSNDSLGLGRNAGTDTHPTSSADLSGLAEMVANRYYGV